MLATPKCMQQIAILIITFPLYVQAIRNAATTGSTISTSIDGNYERPPAAYDRDDGDYAFDYRRTGDVSGYVGGVARPQATHGLARQTTNKDSAFRPSQLLQFTVSDASTAQQQRHEHPPATGAGLRYAMDKRFAFPDAGQQREREHRFGVAPTPSELPTTPIFTYRDPYTNENHPYTPKPSAGALQHYHGLQTQAQTQEPQEFTVQSTLLVGGDGHGDSNGNGNGGYHTNRVGADQLRPGYVFDEHLSPSTSSSLSSSSFGGPSYTNAHLSKYGEYASHPNALAQTPGYGRERPTPPAARAPITAHPQLSYDSHDYPPPSYFEQQTSNFQSPQRQDTPATARPTTAPPTAPPYRPPARPPPYTNAVPSNYANNYGNYLHGAYDSQDEYPGDAYTQPPRAPRPPAVYRPQIRPPSSAAYLEYQQGEIPPPPPSNYYSHYKPPQQPASPVGGLASLATLFTNTQQYAPQFTNLLLGGGGAGNGAASYGGGGGGGSNALGSFFGALTGSTQSSGGGAPGGRPPNMQLIRALENIARNDDLQCVPKVLCQTIAGQTQRGQLPGFVTSPAITNFLAGFPATSPALIYGRAALLGISGGDRSCAQTYAQCPKNEIEIIYYLNNHRGGFFKFFSEPDEQQQHHHPQQQHTETSSDGSSLFSILSALTGNPVRPATTVAVTTTTPRPTRRPTSAAGTGGLDIASGIGNFFTRVLSDYLSGVEYQRRRRRRRSTQDMAQKAEADLQQPIPIRRTVEERVIFEDDNADDDGNDEEEANEQPETADTDNEDFHDEEDDQDTQHGVQHASTDTADYDDDEDDDTAEGRILHKDVAALDGPRFFPDAEKWRDAAYKNLITAFNRKRSQKKLKFPSATEVRLYEATSSGDRELNKFQHADADDEHHTVIFEDALADATDNSNAIASGGGGSSGGGSGGGSGPSYALAEGGHKRPRGARVVFPGDLAERRRKARILNNPPYAATYVDYVRSHDDDRDKLVVSDSHRQPHYNNNDDNNQQNNNINSNYNYNRYDYESQSASVAQSSTHTQYTNYGHGVNRPGQRPSAASSYNYPHSNYVSNNRYSGDYPRSTQRPAVAAPRPDDNNVYVTNGQGVTTHYVRPDGRKVYL